MHSSSEASIARTWTVGRSSTGVEELEVGCWGDYGRHFVIELGADVSPASSTLLPLDWAILGRGSSM